MKRLIPFGLLQISNIMSGVGNGIVMIVVPWLVLDRTGSAAAAGLLGALVSLPGIFVSPVVGVLIDRVGRRMISILADILSAISVVLFVVVDRLGTLTYFWITMLAILGAIFDPAGYTARKALIPDAAIASEIKLETANSRHEGLLAVGWVLGPALGALLIGWTGPVNAMLVTSGFFAIASLSVLAMKVSDEGQRSRSDESRAESFWHSTSGGFRALRRDRALFTLTLIFMFIAAIYIPIETVLLPVHFESLGDPGGLGATMSAIALGMMIGAFSYGLLARRISRYAILRLTMIAVAVGTVPMALLPPTSVFVVVGFLLGVGWGPFNPLWNTLVQRRIKADLHGRVYGVQMSLLYAAPPVGQLVVGLAVERLGLKPTYIVVAGLFSIVALLVISLPALRDLSNDRVASAP